MSEELCDEVEAINSIYGDGCLVAADEPATYVLKLPGEASSLRLRFPDSYPAARPEVLGTHHSSGGRKGAGARDLALFRDALASVFTEGVVCLFDAVEEFSRKYEELAADDAAEAEAMEADDGGAAAAAAAAAAEHDAAGPDLSSLPPPPWTLSEVLVDSKSTFLAHVAPVTSPAQARLYVQQLLASDRRFRSATHNMTAWRIRGADGATSYQDCDDDGETAAGGRLLHLMQLMELWDAMVVVSRWYGGVKLGPRRFAVINAVARDAFVRAGMVVDKEKKGKGR
ncbi:Protein IMPACT [Paramyrothecium foliicola]|nr:Protein IMPACT [Paramyrothecium foliicola]